MVPPGAPVLAAASDSGVSSADDITKITTPIFNGTGAEAGASIRLLDTNGTTVIGTGTADGSGNWTVAATVTGDGAHSITAIQADVAGNVSTASAPLVVTIDTTVVAPGAPALTAASDSGASPTDNITNVSVPIFSGTGAEAGATVSLLDTNGTTVIGTGTADGSGNWTVASVKLGDGAHSITAI